MLAERIAENRDALASRSIEAMYADPFWDARFGARGRRFADEDGAHHVDALVTALREDSARPLEEYARWLQVVLCTRGMCTRHIAENFERLSDAIRSLELPDDDRAHALLAQAIAALRHATNGAGHLIDAAAALIADATVALRQSAGEAVTQGLHDPAVHREVGRLLSYVGDAVALDRTDHLVAHVRWLHEWHRSLARTGFVPAALTGLRTAASRLDEPPRAAVARAVDEASAALTS